jgi:argininosuccinate lyase
MKLWGGRFSKAPDALAEAFNASIGVDQRMYAQDIRGSVAHVTMLARQGILTEAERDVIVAALEGIGADIAAGRLTFSTAAEDVHMNIETFLIERVGEVGKKLHTARSRNDQAALDLRLYLRDEIRETRRLALALVRCLIQTGRSHVHTVMPGYTHLQKAQPITLAHHLTAYVQMLTRDVGRLDDLTKRVNVMPLGSGALAGTGFPLDREYVAERLAFDAVTANSLDGVSDRDFAVEFCAFASLLMMHLSRLCEDLVLWSTEEFGFVELDDAFTTGSSIMPQKKNPDLAELIRGKTGRVYGDLMALLTLMKGLPLAYNKDMQEDKEALFDAVDTVKDCLAVLTPMLAAARYKPDAMYRGACGGFTNATDLADYLAGKGVPFRDAHAIVGRAVLCCLENGCALDELALEQYRSFHPAIEADVYAYIAVKACVARRKVTGGPAPEAVRAALDQAEAWLSRAEKENG